MAFFGRFSDRLLAGDGGHVARDVGDLVLVGVGMRCRC
jgi:hypothetical protein